MFREDFLLSRVYVKGEVSNCKYHNSGHIYFSLKDDTGVLDCIMFSSSRQELNFVLQNGQQVIVLGSVRSYSKTGRYQLYASAIRLDGLGILYERFEALKRELGEMGMFSPEYKKEIPPFVQRLGIVTAPEGAALQDMIRTARGRHPGIQIVVYPAKVQGEGATASIAEGIARLDRENCDVIIIGRGGGSYEDLWAFNEEIVARAVFFCNTPIISAVGHETDTVISDYVADLRALTPTGAAQIAVPDVYAVLERIEDGTRDLQEAMSRKLDRIRQEIDQRQLRLKLYAPGQVLRQLRWKKTEAKRRLRMAMLGKLEQNRRVLELKRQRLMGASPWKRMEQGFSLVTDPEGKRVVSVTQVREEELLRLYFSDGCVVSKALSIENIKENLIE